MAGIVDQLQGNGACRERCGYGRSLEVVVWCEPARCHTRGSSGSGLVPPARGGSLRH